MKTIILTGGIAAGKTTVVQHLQKLGQNHLIFFDCDNHVRHLHASGKLAPQLTQLWGKECVHEDGSTNIDYLRQLVFQHKKIRTELEELIHPILKKDCLALQEKSRHTTGVTGFIIDIPLFFESGIDYKQDLVAVVSLSPQTQIKRLIQRNGFSPSLANSIIASQWPMSEKEKRADLVFWNDSTPNLLIAQINTFYNHYFA